MKRRPAATLMEVLIAMFIMSIGMLALLALFPIGAVSMAQALKDDRCAASASMAEQMAIANNLRHDRLVEKSFNKYPGQPVYVDPYYSASIPMLGSVVPRTSLSFITIAQLADRWFTLPDDIAFAGNGLPDVSSGLLDRGRRYSWAYLLRQAQAGNDQAVNLHVVVYAGRPTDIPQPEPTYAAIPQVPNGVSIPSIVDIRRGNWILDTTPNAAGIIHGDFYRVTNVQDIVGNTLLEVQPNLLPHAAFASSLNITILPDAVEVFDKGTSWRP